LRAAKIVFFFVKGWFQSYNPFSIREITRLYIGLLHNQQKTRKSAKKQEIRGGEMSIQIRALALTNDNYAEYRDLIPMMPKLLTLEAHNQPRLTEIPAELPNSLKEINIIETGLREIRALPCSLEYLYCQKNQTVSLPDHMPMNLKVLNCSENQLVELPQLPQTLKILYCFNNPLASVPKWFPDNLSILDISGCGLTQLPARLPKLLTKLKCNNNRLVRLPSKLPNELNSLDCSNNELTEMPVFPEKLQVINARKNKLIIFDFIHVRAHMRISLDNNPGLPAYREPLTHRPNIEYNIELTKKTIWSRRMNSMQGELISTAHRICYSPARVERLINTGEFDMTELGGDL